MVTTASDKPATLNVSRETWKRLNLLREDPREKFDDVIRRLLDEAERRKEPAGRR